MCTVHPSRAASPWTALTFTRLAPVRLAVSATKVTRLPPGASPQAFQSPDQRRSEPCRRDAHRTRVSPALQHVLAPTHQSQSHVSNYTPSRCPCQGRARMRGVPIKLMQTNGSQHSFAPSPFACMRAANALAARGRDLVPTWSTSTSMPLSSRRPTKMVRMPAAREGNEADAMRQRPIERGAWAQARR
jgi:hypothetical protein